MDDFKFNDRPNTGRLGQTISEYATADTNVDAAALFLDLQWTYREMQKAYDDVLAEYDLTETRFIILMFLFRADQQQLAPSEIATKLGATRPTVTKILNKLVVNGWVTKVSAVNDKRSVMIELTTTGTLVLEKFLPHNFEAVQVIMSELSQDEITTLSTLLHKVTIGTNKLNEKKETNHGNH
ncbi:MarR family winged helix-turn-helix transcriptional regulator [Lactiplantibacillus herbarum]|uniref:MarR family winged helix-turn-helix transcriptional regulator n=1 Tax=Lactiplantibacillus herbarum TaxID=1670446 RepID=UPI00064EA445|nr:MarR family transcriptional regulator [Lactiplantibacillus herbarum]